MQMKKKQIAVILLLAAVLMGCQSTEKGTYDTTEAECKAENGTETEVIDENRKEEVTYGIAEPDLSDTEYVKVVKQVEDYEDGAAIQTYAADYDGDGQTEALVIIGKEESDYFEDDYLWGDLWFVDSQGDAVVLNRLIGAFKEQEYISWEDKIYLFFSYSMGNPCTTKVYSVEDGKAVDLLPYGSLKDLDEDGRIICTQDDYDTNYMIDEPGEDGIWTGHTQKNYTFEFKDGTFKEVGAKEVTLKELEENAVPVEEFKELKSDSRKQYILRDNGELNVNMAMIYDDNIDFSYATYRLQGDGTWQFAEEGDGIYKISLSGDEQGDFVDEAVTEMQNLTFAGDHNVNGRELPIYCVDTTEKKIALTFDAAWGNTDTRKILEVLEKHNIQVTFFMTGGFVESYPDDVKAIQAAGHELGNHSENHKNMSQLTDEEKKEELMLVHEKVQELTGYDMFLFRPPYGDYDNAVVEVALDCGYYPIAWDVDSLDWENKGVDAMIKAVTENEHLGGGSIILCHNGAEYTAEALDELINILENEGYTFVTVSDLIYRNDYHLNFEGRQIKNS